MQAKLVDEKRKHLHAAGGK